MKIRKAVIPAAGLGTRMLPISRAVPKEMLPIVDRPAISYLVDEAVASGITDILIITNRDKDIMEDYFDISPEYEQKLRASGKTEEIDAMYESASKANVYFLRQKVTKGLGHAVGCAKAFIGDEPFCVLYGDDIIFSETPVCRQLIDAYEKYGRAVCGVKAVPDELVMKYCSLKAEKIDGSVNRSGLTILSSAVFFSRPTFSIFSRIFPQARAARYSSPTLCAIFRESPA